MSRSLIDRIFFLTIIVLLLFLIKNIFHQISEDRVLNDYLEFIEAKQGHSQRHLAIAISDKIRKDFNVQSDQWKHIKERNEPTLRYSAYDLLKWKEGHCGKGTRVLVLLLHKVGINATRVTLYGPNYFNRTSHTLVSIVLNQKEHFIDSINSTEEWNELVRSRRVATALIFPQNHQNENANFEIIPHPYLNYSYESMPFFHISRSLGLSKPKFNHTRPHRVLSWFMESVYTQMIVFYTLLIVSILLVWGRFRRSRTKSQV